MQLQFDSRSQLSKSCKLGIFFDATCTQEISSFDADDSLPGESICVPTSCVWLHYRCEQNREQAWGYKLRGIPMRWRVRNELQLATTPFDSGWELLQLLVEEVRGIRCIRGIRYIRSGCWWRRGAAYVAYVAYVAYITCWWSKGATKSTREAPRSTAAPTFAARIASPGVGRSQVRT